MCSQPQVLRSSLPAEGCWGRIPTRLGWKGQYPAPVHLEKGAHSSAHAINAPSLTPVAFLGKCKRRAPQVTRSLGSLSSLSLCELLSAFPPLGSLPEQDGTQPSATTQPLTMPRNGDLPAPCLAASNPDGGTEALAPAQARLPRQLPLGAGLKGGPVKSCRNHQSSIQPLIL